MILRPQNQVINSIIDGCFPFPFSWKDMFPILLGGFMKGQELASNGTDEQYPYSIDELAKRIHKTTLPALAQAKSQKEVDGHMKEIYFAFPAAKELVSSLSDETDDTDIQGLVWVPWAIAAVVTYAIAYTAGYKQGSEDNGDGEN